jgi:hypothetical protein
MEVLEWQMDASQYWHRQRNDLQEDLRAENYGHGRFNFQEGGHELFWAFRRW